MNTVTAYKGFDANWQCITTGLSRLCAEVVDSKAAEEYRKLIKQAIEGGKP